MNGDASLKKRLTSPLQDARNALAKEFAPQPIGGRAQPTQKSQPPDPGTAQPRYALKPEVKGHMALLFKSQKDLCDALETTPKTWKDATTDEGVRYATARKLLIAFISLVRKAAKGESEAMEHINDQLVTRMDEIYAPYLSSFEFDALMTHKS